MVTEWSHRARVRLYDWGAHVGQQLRHLLTGEVVSLGLSAHLRFDGALAFLEPDGGSDDEREPVWANDLLSLSVHSSGAEESEVDAYVWNKVSRTSAPFRDHEQSVSVQPLCIDGPNGVFKAELYVHDCPKSSMRCSKFFTAPWVQNVILRGDGGSRWCTKNVDCWCHVLRSLGRESKGGLGARNPSRNSASFLPGQTLGHSKLGSPLFSLGGLRGVSWGCLGSWSRPRAQQDHKDRPNRKVALPRDHFGLGRRPPAPIAK